VSIETEGVLINNLKEYREQVAGIYGDGWKKNEKERLFEVFGKPKEYPFILCIQVNTNDTYGNREMIKVYLRKTPKVRSYYGEFEFS